MSDFQSTFFSGFHQWLEAGITDFSLTQFWWDIPGSVGSARKKTQAKQISDRSPDSDGDDNEEVIREGPELLYDLTVGHPDYPGSLTAVFALLGQGKRYIGMSTSAPSGYTFNGGDYYQNIYGSFGGRQFSAYLLNQESSWATFFNDPYFVKLLLQSTTGDYIKDGVVKSGYYIKDGDTHKKWWTDDEGGAKYPDGDLFKGLHEELELLKNGLDSSSGLMNQNATMRNYALKGAYLSSPVGTMFDETYGTGIDRVYRHRIHPAIVGGREKNLIEAFREHLEGKGSPRNWTEDEVDLFYLWSGGDKYGSNTVPYLNVLAAAESATNSNSSIYRYITTKTRNFWKENYSKANAQALVGTKAYDVLTDFLGEEPTPELFAKHVTHGIAATDGLIAELKGTAADNSSGIEGYISRAKAMGVSGDMTTIKATPFTMTGFVKNVGLFYPKIPTGKYGPYYNTSDRFNATVFQKDSDLNFQHGWLGRYGGAANDRVEFQPLAKEIALGKAVKGISREWWPEESSYQGKTTGIPGLRPATAGEQVAEPNGIGTFGRRISQGDTNPAVPADQTFDFSDEMPVSSQQIYDYEFKGGAIEPFRINSGDTIYTYSTLDDDAVEQLSTAMKNKISNLLSGRSIEIVYPEKFKTPFIPLIEAAAMVNQEYTYLMDPDDGRLVQYQKQVEVVASSGVLPAGTQAESYGASEFTIFPYANDSNLNLVNYGTITVDGVEWQDAGDIASVLQDTDNDGYVDGFYNDLRQWVPTDTYGNPVDPTQGRTGVPGLGSFGGISGIDANGDGVFDVLDDLTGTYRPIPVFTGAEIPPQRLPQGKVGRGLAVQMWIDAVNVASSKLAQWMVYANATIDITARYFSVVSLAASNYKKDQIAEIFADAGIEKGKPNPKLGSGLIVDLKDDPEPDKKLTKQQIKEILEQRTKNIDQCLLLTNMDFLRQEYDGWIQYCLTHDGSYGWSEHAWNHMHSDDFGRPCAFGDRFHRITDSEGQYNKTPNYFGAAKGDRIRPFFEITPEIMSSLTPKIRLFRISNNPDGSEKEIEFTFENYISQETVSSLNNPQSIQKGTGGGIKNFSFTYEGGSPATATKDINAELTLFFQSFNELTKFRTSGNKERYKYIDLLLYPSNRKNTSNGKTEAESKNIHPNEYNPTNFRIRAEVGWNIRNDQSFRDMLYSRLSDDEHRRYEVSAKADPRKVAKQMSVTEIIKHDVLKDFNNAIRMTNKTFLLNMVDHDIDFRNDGSVELKIQYAAYMDSRTRGSDVNALSTPQIEAYKGYLRNKIAEKQKEQSCTLRQLQSLNSSVMTAEEIYVKAAQGSLVKRLLHRKLKRSVVFSKAQTTNYSKRYSTAAPAPIRPYINARAMNNEELEVEFYFLGDILHTVLDCLYLPPGEFNPDNAAYDPRNDEITKFSKRRKDMQNYKILLSTFTYTDHTTNFAGARKDPYFVANIADMPISAKYLNDWLVENVTKPERVVYPVTDFVKDLLRSVVDLLTDACLNRRMQPSLMFQTGQFMGIGGEKEGLARLIEKGEGFVKGVLNKAQADLTTSLDWALGRRTSLGSSGTEQSATENRAVARGYPDPLSLVGLSNESLNQPIAANLWHHRGILPLRSFDPSFDGIIPTESLYKYTLIYPVAPVMSVSHKGEGVRHLDEERGTYHFQIGSNRGLLKNVKFNKTDMAYLREARFYNQGNYGLLQLGAVYNVELELFGNTLFYPGMEIFIDPRGFGGTDWDPTSTRTVANALGIGGYHIITKVTSEIAPDGFSTSISALWQHSGAPSDRANSINGNTSNEPVAAPIEQAGPNERENRKCEELLDQILSNNLRSYRD